jgi:hypothetical protein
MVREGQVGGLAPHRGMVSSHSIFGSIHWISSHFVCVCSVLTALACLFLLLIICHSHHVLEECLHPRLSHTGSLHIFFVNAMCMILYQANKLLSRFGFSRNNIFIMYIGI